MPGSFYRYLREAHDRTTARCSSSPWMLACASAKDLILCLYERGKCCIEIFLGVVYTLADV